MVCLIIASFSILITCLGVILAMQLYIILLICTAYHVQSWSPPQTFSAVFCISFYSLSHSSYSIFTFFAGCVGGFGSVTAWVGTTVQRWRDCVGGDDVILSGDSVRIAFVWDKSRIYLGTHRESDGSQRWSGSFFSNHIIQT